MARASRKVVRLRRRPPRRRRKLDTIVSALALFLCWAAQGVVRTALPGEEFAGRVLRIVDGDTLRIAGMRAPIRLWGVDAPERNAAGGGEATAALTRFARGQKVRCKVLDRDRYARVVARCFLGTGDDLSAMMIGSGAAREYLHYTGGFYVWRRLIQPERRASTAPSAP